MSLCLLRLSKVRCGKAWPDTARQVRQSPEWFGAAGPDEARRDKAGLAKSGKVRSSIARQCIAWLSRAGVVRHGEAWLGEAGLGKVLLNATEKESNCGE